MSPQDYQPQGFCPDCEYPIDPGICPECGAAVTAKTLVIQKPDARFKNPFRTVECITLIFAGVATGSGILIMAIGARNPSAFLFMIPFAGWVMLPYWTFYRVTTSQYRKHYFPGLPACACITAVLMVALSFYAYIDAMFIHTTSTSVLIFAGMPFWLLIGGPIMLFGLVGISRLFLYFTK